MSSNTEFGDISFDLPKNQSNVIKVIGVGGGGSNAINHMFKQGIKGVDFVICNTDAQALENSPVPNKIQLGVSLTEGLGAGANPEVGEQAAIESVEEIKRMLDTNTKMVFITAGMGGGTGTGAAPIIAKMSKELDILTVGIVTIPFQFEGKMRNEQARQGVERLRSHVDSLIVINNNKLREVYGNLGFKAGFSKADEVLSTASRGIAEVITHHYTQNIDLRDAKTVLSNSGTAIMGSGSASGASRAQEAISKALDSPLLNDNKIKGAKNVLLLIVSGDEEITLDEIGEINDHIQTEAGNVANIIMGVGEDENLGDAISVTIIATGFNAEQQHDIVNIEAKKIVHTLEEDHRTKKSIHPDTPLKTKTPITNATVIEPQIPSEASKTVVRHVLEQDTIEDTTSVKNTDVVLEQTNTLAEQEFVITDVTDTKEVIDKEKEQVTLSFDFPLNTQSTEQDTTSEQPVVFDLMQDQTTDTTNSSTDEKEQDQATVKHNLEDAVVPQDDIVFEKKTVAPSQVPPMDKEDTAQEQDPFNSSIEETLKNRTEERKRRLKEFNHKFNNNLGKISDIEKEPAYKRMGIDLSENCPDQATSSRISITEDSNKDIQLRSNNSFLHDNVD